MYWKLEHDLIIMNWLEKTWCNCASATIRNQLLCSQKSFQIHLKLNKTNGNMQANYHNIFHVHFMYNLNATRKTRYFHDLISITALTLIESRNLSTKKSLRTSSTTFETFITSWSAHLWIQSAGKLISFSTYLLKITANKRTVFK